MCKAFLIAEVTAASLHFPLPSFCCDLVPSNTWLQHCVGAHVKGTAAQHAASQRADSRLCGMVCRNQVVVSPHVYPPSITTAQDHYLGPDLNSRLSLAHSYLNKAPGFCTGPGNAGTCRTFPVVLGEFGTQLLDPRDLLMEPQV